MKDATWKSGRSNQVTPNSSLGRCLEGSFGTARPAKAMQKFKDRSRISSYFLTSRALSVTLQPFPRPLWGQSPLGLGGSSEGPLPPYSDLCCL